MAKPVTTLVHDGVKFEVMEITSKQAQRWLDKHAKAVQKSEYNQRKLSKREVHKLLNKIYAGHWRFTGDPIRIDKQGFIIDGFTRLNAIAELEDGRGLISLVATGFPNDLILYLDQGRKRNVRHQFEAKGHGEDAKYLAVICRGLFGVANGRETYATGGDEVDILKIDHVPELYGSVLRSIIDITESAKKETKSIKSAPFLTAMALVYQADPELGIEFHRQVAFGENLQRGMPAYLLRQKLINLDTTVKKKSKSAHNDVFALTILAAKKFFDGDDNVESLQPKIKMALQYFKDQQLDTLKRVKNGH